MFTLSVTALPGCGKRTESKTPPHQEEISTESPKNSELTPTDQTACSQFLGEAQRALSNHLYRTSKEFSVLLSASYQLTLKEILETQIFAKDPTKIEALLSRAPAAIQNCSPFVEASKDFTFPEAKVSPLIVTLRLSLRNFTRLLDHFSSYSFPKAPKMAFGSGIRIKSRTDYILGRKPNYFVIEGVYDQSANRELEGEFKTYNRIYAIQDPKGAWIEAKNLTFSEMFLRLNVVGNISSIPVKLKNQRSEKEVALAVGPFIPSLSHFRWIDERKGVALIDLTSFSTESSADDFKNEGYRIFKNLFFQNRRSIKGLIIDLRGNLGGSIEQARQMLESFLPVGTTTNYFVRVENQGTSEGPKKNATQLWRTVYDDVIPLKPLIVLVDRLTASASEIVVAALQDYGRVLIVGEPTFGKSIVQMDYPMDEPLGGVMSVTNGISFSPKGICHQVNEVIPDIEIAGGDPVLNQIQPTNPKLNRMRTLEKDFPDTIIPKQPPLKVDFQIPKGLIQISDPLRKALKAQKPPHFEECQHLPGPNFDEEKDDCILATARFYMDRLISMDSR